MVVLSDLEDRPGEDPPDVAIVGAGAVGLLLAVDLARSGKRVLLLEAGQDMPNAPDYVFDEVESTGRLFKGLTLGRFRALGGTTTKWGGQLVPLEPIVFERRDWLGEAGWPICAEDLAPAYEATLDLLGMKRRLGDAEVWHQLKVTPPPTGEDIEFFLTRWAPEPNFARLFASDLANNPLLVAVTGARVTGLYGRDGSTRVGLVVRNRGKTTKIEAGHVVLANGTIEAARLMLQPLQDGSRAPWGGNPWLGRGFADHVDAYAGHVRPLDQQRFNDVFDAAVLAGLKYLPKLKLTEQCQRREGLFGIAAHFVTSSSHSAQLAALKTVARNILNRTGIEHERFDFAQSVQLLNLLARTATRYLRHRRIYNPADHGIQLRLTGEQLIIRESGLSLTHQRDSSGMAMARLDWRVDGAELTTMARFAQMVADYLASAGLAEVELDPLLVARDSAFLEKLEDGYHHMGMARMAPTPQDGVVDRELKVFGTENLFVAGAATFRSAGFANPTFAALALAVRLSQTLRRQASAAPTAPFSNRAPAPEETTEDL